MPNDIVPDSDLPAALKLKSVPASGASDIVPPEDLPAHLRYPVTTPSELPGRIAGMPAALGGWVKEHPVDAALTAASAVMPLAGGLGELGGLGGMAARTAIQGGIGGATAGLTGQSVSSGVKEGLLSGGLGELPGMIGPVVSGLGKATKAATNVMRDSAVDTVSQKAIENELGTTGAQAQSLAQPTAPGQGAQPLAQAKGALRQARHSAIQEVGRKYEPIYGPIENQPIAPDDLTSIGTAHRDSMRWLYSKGAKVAPSTAKLLSKFAGYTGEEPVIGVPGGANASLVGEIKPRPGDEPIPIPTRASTSAPALGNTPSRMMLDMAGGLRPAQPAPTVGQLRGHLGQLMMEANRPGAGAMERKAIGDAAAPILKTLQTIIPDEQKPLLQQINNEYSQINRILPFKNQQKLMTAGTLPQLGEMAFSKGNEAATSMVLSRMDEQQKGLMRDAFASYVLSDTDAPTKTLSKLQANKDVVKALYPDSDFGNINKWREMMLAQRRMAQGPKGLPSQKQFSQAVQENIKRSGLSPEALQAASDALVKGNQKMPYILKYATTWGLIGAMGGWGIFGHAPELIPVAAAYGAGHLGWRAIASNPAALDAYRDFVMNGWTRKGGDAFGRLLVGAANDWLRGTGQPDKQAVGHMGDMSEGTDALDQSRAEHLAPTPSATDRAQEVSQDLQKGKIPEVHQDLNRGRLAHEELTKLLQYASAPGAMKLIAGIPLSEVLDALEVASPEEKEILIPLVKQRLMQELPQQQNKTLQANLSKRFQKIAASSQTPDTQQPQVANGQSAVA